MEGATSGRSRGQERSGRPSRSHGAYERTYSKGSVSCGEKGDERQRKEARRTTEGSNSRGAIAWQGQDARGSRHKRSRSPHGSPCDSKENGHPAQKVRAPPFPAHGRGKDRPDATRAGRQGPGGSAHPPRRPASSTGRRRCRDGPEAGPASPKRRRRHLSPEVRGPLEVLTSRLLNQVEALQVVLEELQAPGGAFLPVPARGTEPAASQRAWLSWQLAHAGANLHWALASLDALLAEQPRGPAAPWPQRAHPGSAIRGSRFPAHGLEGERAAEGLR